MMVEKYGKVWGEIPEGVTEEQYHFGIERECFRTRRTVEQGGLGAAQHFKNISLALFNKRTKDFIWHPWADIMLEAAIENKYLAISGGASVGKTNFGAIWALINWLCDPAGIKILVTSTSLKESRKRIWGAIIEYYNSVPKLYGKLVDSMGILKSTNDDGTVMSDRFGIEMIPGEKKKEKEAIAKMIGIKQAKVIMIADELPELSEAILTACYSNLSSNPEFQLIGMGNFKSMYDPFGILCTPKLGYGSITPDMEEWETERGKCIKFDGLKSPNILLGRDIWPIYGSVLMAEHLKLGENSAMFWRMCRSHPCPEGEEHTIYSESELMRGKVHEQAIFLGDVTNLAFLDPGFTNDGDRSMLTFARIGVCTDGKVRLEFTEYLQLFENVSLKDRPRAFQIAEQFRDMCMKRKVSQYHAGYDSTGAGAPFGDVVDEVWNPNVMRLNFGGNPTDLPIAVGDSRTSKEAYSKRVSEIWYVGLEFMRSDQIRGMPIDSVKELKSRRYTTKKSDGNTKIEVEPKSEMKKRLGYSPDLADSCLGLIGVARERLGFLAGGSFGKKTAANDDWNKLASKTNEIYSDIDYSAQEEWMEA